MVTQLAMFKDTDNCFYCGKPLNGNFAADHLVPQKTGGPDEGWNYLRACQTCNSRKGASDIYTFLRITACYETWPDEKKSHLLNKLQKAIEKGFLTKTYVSEVRSMLGIRPQQEFESFDYGTIRPQGVGLRLGEIEAMDAIAETEGVARNALLRIAVRHFLRQYRDGTIDLANYFDTTIQTKRRVTIKTL